VQAQDTDVEDLFRLDEAGTIRPSCSEMTLDLKLQAGRPCRLRIEGLSVSRKTGARIWPANMEVIYRFGIGVAGLLPLGIWQLSVFTKVLLPGKWQVIHNVGWLFSS
jgi:hypothetical protein